MVRSVAASVALVCCVAVFPHRALAAPTTTDALQALARDMTLGWAKRHPFFATGIGLRDEDGRLDDPSESAVRADVATIAAWRARLDAIPLAGATLHDRDDATLLRAQLVARERQYARYRTFRKDYSQPGQDVTNALFTQFQHLPIAGTSGATASDVATAWDAIVARLAGAPAYIDAAERLVTTPGHLYGVTGAQQLAGAPDFFNGALTDAARAQISPERFAAFATARDATLAALAREKQYIDAHAAAWPENYAMGRTAYDAMLRDEQLLPFDGAAVEGMARDELAHGSAVGAWVDDLAARRGTAIGYRSGGGLAPGGPALVGYYRDRIAQLRAFVTTQRVVDVPDWLGRIDVVETPKFLQPVSPGASMNPPLLLSPDTTGFYYITPPVSLADAAARLDPNQDFDADRILSTGAHEAMPGHFLQLSIARRHPDYVRKIQNSGVFAEGWAFYGEELFVELGLYGEDLDARSYTAQWERVRGARAIVDPELASGTMTYDAAATFFAERTGFPIDAARAAVAGIALQPGYVISYTVGRYQLESLLAAYRAKTGAAGSLRDFHDRLLSYGTTPFAIVAPELIADLAKPLAEVRAAANY